MKINKIEDGKIIETKLFSDKHSRDRILNWGRTLIETFSKEELKKVTKDTRTQEKIDHQQNYMDDDKFLEDCEKEEEIYECAPQIFFEFERRVLALRESDDLLFFAKRNQLSKFHEDYIDNFIAEKASGYDFWERIYHRISALSHLLIFERDEIDD
ncbi:hypothetical protein [Nitrospira sp. BLG_2]|uniref:hypothetical protein n=1 Tax=Nitrospira sp. BLG_2 TaxID=3397507 RepID=UPI003B9978B8